MTSKLDTFPAIFDLATPELIPIGVDFTKRLGLGETVTGVVAVTITDPRSGTLVPLALSGAASAVSPIITQTVDASQLFQLPTDTYWDYVVTAQIGSRRESTLTKLRVLF